MKKLIEGFTPQGGAHCITNALKQIFDYYEHPLSEAMLFGLASGISFLYLNQANSPMINGRTKVFEFEKTLAKRLNIEICCKSSNKDEQASLITKQMIDHEHPVFIYVDMPYLSYLGMDKAYHFGGHGVVIFGYDDTTQTYWVSDRDQGNAPIRTPHGKLAQDYHLVTYEELRNARSSKHRPFPAHNKYLTFNFQSYREVDKAMLYEAMQEACEGMLYPSAHLLGLQGIDKFAKQVKTWKHFCIEKRKLAGVTNYFQISQDGGTGGGIFRYLYGDFLIEASQLIKQDELRALGEQFHGVAALWDEVAQTLWQLAMDGKGEHLPCISTKVQTIYEKETALFTSLLEVVTTSR